MFSEWVWKYTVSNWKSTEDIVLELLSFNLTSFCFNSTEVEDAYPNGFSQGLIDMVTFAKAKILIRIYRWIDMPSLCVINQSPWKISISMKMGCDDWTRVHRCGWGTERAGEKTNRKTAISLWRFLTTFMRAHKAFHMNLRINLNVTDWRCYRIWPCIGFEWGNFLI